MKGSRLLSSRHRIGALLREHRAIVIVMGLLFLERVLAFCSLGLNFSLGSDDRDYIISGIYFGNTGTVTMHGQVSAQIMPGMPWFIGLLSIIFGEGRLLLCVLRLCWALMGTFTALYIYRCVTLYAPKWCGILAALPLFAPNYAWLDNLILTETPYIFCSAAMIYHTLQMARTKRPKHFWFTTLFYMLTLLLKANAAVYPLFAAIFLLLRGYGFKRLLKQGLILAGVVLLFIVPWTIRNYKQFHTFVPLTYGSGNPLLLGTAQGASARKLTDNPDDYSSYVETNFRERYAKYLNEDGTAKEPDKNRFLSLLKDKIRAEYRIKEWYDRDPTGLIHAYLVEKPSIMVNKIYYENELFGVSADRLTDLRWISYLLAIGSFFLAFILKKYRAEMVFLAALYVGNLYIYAFTYAFSRYGQTLVHFWYIMIGLGIYLLCLGLLKGFEAVKAFSRRADAAQQQQTTDKAIPAPAAEQPGPDPA